MAENTATADAPAKEKKVTPAQQVVLDIEASAAFNHEQTALLHQLVAALDASAGHGGYTYDGRRLFANEADKAYRIERNPETGQEVVYNGPGGKS